MMMHNLSERACTFTSLLISGVEWPVVVRQPMKVTRVLFLLFQSSGAAASAIFLRTCGRYGVACVHLSGMAVFNLKAS
jgi:hypothetical protein